MSKLQWMIGTHGAELTPMRTSAQRLLVPPIMMSSPTFPWTTLSSLQIDDDIACAAASPANVMITGERGSGKKSVARLIHGRSSRRKGPFVIGNALAVDPERSSPDADMRGLLEPARNGSFLLEGLDNVVNARDEAELRRFVDLGTATESNVRFMAASRTSLCERVQAGQFPEDLFYRLNVIHVIIPPLRQRPEDIPFLLRYCTSGNDDFGCLEFSDAALDRLMEYSWPGNVLELKTLSEELMNRVPRRRIEVDDLPLTS